MSDIEPPPVTIAIAAVVAGKPMLATAAGAVNPEIAALVPPVAGAIAKAAHAIPIAPNAIAHATVPLATIFTVPLVMSPVISILLESHAIAFANSL